MNDIAVVLVAMYRYQNYPVRTMCPMLKEIDGIKPHAIFFKDSVTNTFKLPTYQEEKLFVNLIIKLNPKLVGFSVLSPYVPIAKRLTKLVRDNSSSLIIWGGIHPTVYPESCIDEADMLCIGEGEGALSDLVKCLKDGKSYQTIENLWVEGGDHIFKNPMRPLVQNLDSLPYPSYGYYSYYLIYSGMMTKSDPLLSDNSFSVQTSRGCPYPCSYCVNSLLQSLFKNLGHYTRRRSVSNIIKEIKEKTCKGYNNQSCSPSPIPNTCILWKKRIQGERESDEQKCPDINNKKN